MIDMHCHIIPKIDDGSRSEKMSIEMARRAYECGYTGIFATSHFIEIEHETKKADFKNRVDILNKKIREQGINIEIYVGNEVYFTPNVVSILNENTRISTLNNSKYFLMEFPMTGNIINLANIIAEIVNSGYIPIIAHPERYEFTTHNFDILKQIIEIGALLQINVASISGLYGNTAKKNVKNLLKNNMVHFIGTDAHNDTRVYDIYDKSIKKISKIIDKTKLHKILYENPKKVKNNERIELEFFD